ncbi:hypothetical protein ABFX02_12G164700 [Erythranthe guttata]|nr:PREDICTED: TBC1 domain family member 5 homolog B-like [Erythranthe guttata]|eukprot:XP_012836218.1 PREDICTED: TBC1 domain family member 5 homolog B-like [Erythranthe guttata]
MPETTSSRGGSHCYVELRGVQWRLGLGILPSSPSPSIDDLRRVTANYRRRYAALRKQLLVDPHVPKDGSNSPGVVMDNPLSQNPDSMWGRFFRNAELEKMVDQDLTRLYPETGSYFQTTGCQAMLRRILLLWCLSHPEYGYRQGMHELLAPLLYVLHVDVERLSEVEKSHKDHFADKFDGFTYHENGDSTYKLDFKKFDGSDSDKSSAKANNLTELDPVTQTIVLLSDPYGAESELGIVLSKKFMEHDAYSMFDALMSGAHGVVSMAEFFSPSPYGSSLTGFSPVIEASSAMYHLLSVVDSPLHTHLVELGVEPQYFSLRWLRVLFGREFSLEDLLLLWDEIFACDNTKCKKVEAEESSNCGVLDSPRGAFISAFAVSMILKLRASLLATGNATSCLQKLVNFPNDVNLEKLVAKAKSLQALAAEVNSLNSIMLVHNEVKPASARGHSLSLDSSSYPRTLLNVVPESYWEEKWRVLHNEEEHKQGVGKEEVPKIRKGWSERVKLRLSRTETDPPPLMKTVSIKLPEEPSSVIRSLFGSDENKENSVCDEVVEQQGSVEVADKKFGSGEIPLNFSDPPSPIHGLENSSVASNSSVDENEAESCGTHREGCPPVGVSAVSNGPPSEYDIQNDESTGKSVAGVKERSFSGKFLWLRKFEQNGVEGATCEGCDNSCESSKGETVDQNTMVSLRNLGEAMLENIQVIESVFETGSPENGKVTAMSALNELRKISNLLSQM